MFDSITFPKIQDGYQEKKEKWQQRIQDIVANPNSAPTPATLAEKYYLFLWAANEMSVEEFPGWLVYMKRVYTWNEQAILVNLLINRNTGLDYMDGSAFSVLPNLMEWVREWQRISEKEVFNVESNNSLH